MKKLLVALAIAVLLAASLFAYSNQQKIYSVDSGVYKAMETLYILAGKALPSSSGPWSEAELQKMLAKIDKASLSDAAQNYYDYVEGLITSEPNRQYADNFAMEFGLDLDLELYFHTNGDKFDDFDDWFHSYTDRQKFLAFTFETWPTNRFYGYFSFDLGLGTAKNDGDGNPLYKAGLSINMPIVNEILFTKKGIFDAFNWHFPERAIVAAGGTNWSFMAGRDRLSWGSGETGNLMLSDSFPVHTMARFNTFFDAFKYSLVATIYPFDSNNAQYDSLDGYKAMLVHRIEFNMFKDKVGFIINEACMFWSNPDAVDGDGNPDPQQFTLAQINPFGFMHNEYVPRNANSLLVFEANYTPFAGVNAYAQFAVDEFSGPGEGKWNPAAFGFLAGAKAAFAAGSGIMTGSLEFAKTDPYLYIRGLHYNNNENNGYGFDAIYRSFVNGYAMVNNRMFTTYKYGNDVKLFDARMAYELPGVFKIGFEALLLSHGVMNINSAWGMYQGNDDPTPVVTTPSTYNVFDPADYNYATHTVIQEHPVEKTTVLSLTAEYIIANGLSANLAADFVFVKNQGNVADNNGNDIQLTLGLRYEI
ncbi:MAG: hypothetical protein IKX15_03370 [Spirochaetales bacterium]|nr:hypothetical protein [Spirochaetales bacterium]